MNITRRHAEMAGAIDRYGGDFARWPDPVLANETRVALLADRGLRARFDSAVALDRVLAAARDALDGEIAAAGSAERVRATVRARRRAARRMAGRRWIAVAAGLVIAAGIGSVIDLTVVGSNDQVVMVDPLVFGTATVDAQ